MIKALEIELDAERQSLEVRWLMRLMITCSWSNLRSCS